MLVRCGVCIHVVVVVIAIAIITKKKHANINNIGMDERTRDREPGNEKILASNQEFFGIGISIGSVATEDTKHTLIYAISMLFYRRKIPVCVSVSAMLVCAQFELFLESMFAVVVVCLSSIVHCNATTMMTAAVAADEERSSAIRKTIYLNCVQENELNFSCIDEFRFMRINVCELRLNERVCVCVCWTCSGPFVCLSQQLQSKNKLPAIGGSRYDYTMSTNKNHKNHLMGCNKICYICSRQTHRPRKLLELLKLMLECIPLKKKKHKFQCGTKCTAK